MTSKTSLYSQAINAGIQGGQIMLISAVPVNACNLLSVICCHENLTARQAMWKIYSGKVHGGSASAIHFLKGMSGHLMKEFPRLFIKVGVLTFVKPDLEQFFRRRDDSNATLKTAIIVSLLWGGGEAAINPFDTLRTMWQSGKGVRESLMPGQSLVGHLYAGSVANGLRQAATVWMFSYSELAANRCMEATPIDPHSLEGAIVKSPVQGALTTAAVYLPERIKNVLQFHPDVRDHAHRTKSSCYIAAFRHIISHQGFQGLTRGMVPKTWSITIMTAGANYLVELGRGNLNRVDEGERAFLDRKKPWNKD
ncbi:MAG: hypothetical protein JSR93_00795 [Verrucomicrobia bacterium]|nr:hypothetical protein [Verrucomicrobiota bacterium]